MPVTKRGESWQAQVNHKGARYRRQFETKKDALQWEADAKSRVLRGEQPDMGELARREGGRPYTLGELKEYVYRAHWAPMRGGDKALINATSIVNTIGAGKPIAKVDVASVRAAREKLLAGGNAQSTVNRKVAALSKMLAIAAEEELIDRQPKLPKYAEAEHRVRRFTPDEERAALTLFERIGNQDMVDYVVISLDTGLRQGEVLGLTPANVVGSRLQVWGTHTKGKRSRTIPLTGRVKVTLDRRMAGLRADKPIFPGLNKSSIHHYWNRLSVELDLEHDKQFVPHVMRHEFCSRLADAGRNAPEIMALAGHSSLAVTQRYIHIDGAGLDAAIATLEGPAALPQAFVPATLLAAFQALPAHEKAEILASLGVGAEQLRPVAQMPDFA